jgi:energy-coupling factor transport system ATP-binding protein
MSDLATFDGFGYRYPEQADPALSHVTFDLHGGLTLLGGASGSGKTTLLRSLNGLVPHFHGGQAWGRATILGHDLRSSSTRRLARDVSMVFQEPESQFVLATVRREVAFGPENLGLPASEIAERVDGGLQAMGLLELAERRIATLSGGQRQRVALGAALAMRPTLLVLDEPTSQLDDAGADSLRLACRDLAAQGLAVVVAEHRPWRLDGPGSQRLELDHGSLISPGTTRSGPAPLGAHRHPSSGEVAWELQDLAIGHGVPVATGINLAGMQGEVLCLTGANGSGKTTLLRTIAGLLRPLSGSVQRGPGRCAYLPQEPGGLLHQATLEDEVRQTIRWLRLGCQPGPILREFELSSLAKTDPRDLSTGQRQRAALAAVLVGEPEMVFLDEPTRGADARSRAMLLRVLDRLAASGTAVLVATSDTHFAEQIGDRVLDLNQGRVLARGQAAA